MRWWYLRRAIPWVALLGCCGGAVAAFAVAARWPGQSVMLLPAMLGCCAAAAGFCFDEPAPELAEVTPRGSGWRRWTRASVAVVPLVVWGALVGLRPDRLPLDRAGWWLAGLAAVLLALGAASLAARRGVAAPGSGLASVIALGVFAPVVAGLFVDGPSLYPTAFGGDLLTLWAGLAVLGAGACAAGLRR